MGSKNEMEGEHVASANPRVVGAGRLPIALLGMRVQWEEETRDESPLLD